MKITRFIYPKKDMWYYNRGIKDHAYQLLIASEHSDGVCWFGVTEAIESYCEETGIELSNITWEVRVHPNDTDYSTIKADTIEEWKKQFKALKPRFEEVYT